MLESNPLSSIASAIRRLWPSLGLLLLLGLLLPAVALADSPTPPDQAAEPCLKCHAAETEAWQNSSHAQAGQPEGGVTCEACHGAYVEDHPQQGVMQLEVDSSICQNCHAQTYAEWTPSSHGQANVQCISCHLSHSQEARLTDEALCRTCHRDQLQDFAHTTHQVELACTDCHASTAPATHEAAAGAASPAVPSHSFTVSTAVCVNCHSQTIRPASSPAVEDESQVTYAGFGPLTGQNSELALQLKTVEQANTSLKSMTVTGFGLGLGIGGMVGIIFMLVTGHLCQGRIKS